MTQPSVGQKVMDQLRAIYASRGWTQAKIEQKSGDRLKQSTVSRLLKGVQDDPGLDQVMLFAEALDVDFLDLVAAARGGAKDRRPTVVAELEALRADVSQLGERLGAALRSLDEPAPRLPNTRRRSGAAS